MIRTPPFHLLFPSRPFPFVGGGPSGLGKHLFLLLAAGLMASPGASLSPAGLSAQTSPILTMGGEIRPRALNRNPVDGSGDGWVSMRSRLSLDARFPDGLGLFIQVQDVRLWGEEVTNRDRSADAVDFHQAYLEVEDLPVIGGLLRAGRQEVSVGEGRFLAAPDWGQGGQSFDGAVWSRPLGRGRIDLVYLRLQEESSGVHQVNADLMVGWITLPVQSLGTLELLAIHDGSGGPGGITRTTLGPTWKGATGYLSARVQGMIQTGRSGSRDVQAGMLAIQGTLRTPGRKGSITLWYDRLSGDHDPADGRTGAFTTLYGGRHRYYGRADYFLDIPRDTGGLGLSDGAIKLAWSPDSLLRANLDLHVFHTAEAGSLSSRHLGNEVDLWVRYRFREALALEAGYSLMDAGRAMEELQLLDGTGKQVYLMSSLRF